ncbi:endoribonuclease CG2145 [Anopheles moucheti]|uniref:endoribonuclease CG2145 n=1 Tax=Anopheles moucheti TaxID=186751 RepID=UPI0022F13267|nr:endoribonuclease CG2145 [Anopheles moucheti]
MRIIHTGTIVLLCLALTIDAQWFGSSKKKQDEDPNVALLSYAPVDPSVTPSSTIATPTSTTPIPSTTTKKGFFGKLFGGSSKNEEKSTTTTTTKTTTTTVATPTTKKQGFFSGLFGGKKDKTSTTTVAPSTTARSGTTVKPGTVTTAKASAALPTAVTTAKTLGSIAGVTSTTAKSVSTLSTGAASSTTTTTTTPKSKDAFPALPPSRSGSPTPAPVPTSTVANAWTRTPPTVQPGGKPGVSFVPTTPGTPGAQKVSSTPASASAVGDGPTTDDELVALSELLFTKDTNSPSKFVTINYQKQTSSFVNTDEAPNPFLTVDEAKIYAIPTIEKMHALFNNYELDTMTNEYVTPLEKKEENDFVDALLATNVMRQAMLFLQKKGIVTADPKTHHELLKTIWFTLYSRGNGKIGSSGFEHVFLNEVSNGTMIGLHNWLYVYDMEKAGRIDYKGWNKKMELGTKGEIAKVRLTFDNLQKPSNSLFVGTSPELEIALYTVCFQVRPDKECPLAINGKPFTIKTFTFRYRGKNLIGGAWPNI